MTALCHGHWSPAVSIRAAAAAATFTSHLRRRVVNASADRTAAAAAAAVTPTRRHQLRQSAQVDSSSPVFAATRLWHMHRFTRIFTTNMHVSN